MVNDMQRYMTNDDLVLIDSDKRHIINVMRMRVGEKFQIVNNKKLYTCTITEITKKDVKYVITDTENLLSDKDYKVIIACSIIKEQKMDIMLQKMTELGVDEIMPLNTERTVVKTKDTKFDRWFRILKEASEQSHRLDIPKLSNPIDLKNLGKIDANLKIVCDTKEMSKNIKKVLQENKKSDTILLVVGPEGGFTENEIEYLSNNGFVSVTLGSNILRAETVPLFLLSVINYENMR